MRSAVGEILADSGDITINRLRRASEWQKRNGGSIEKALLSTGAVDEDTLTGALSKATGKPGTTRAALLEATGEVVETLPRDARRRLRALPFGRIGSTLLVAVSDPDNPVLETGLVASTGSNVELFVITDPVLDDCLGHWETALADEPAPAPEPEPADGFEPASDPFERLARALLGEAVQRECFELEIGFDVYSGFARFYNPAHPPLTRRIPIEVTPYVISWLERRAKETSPAGFVVNFNTMEDLPQRFQATLTSSPSAARVVLRPYSAAAPAPAADQAPSQAPSPVQLPAPTPPTRAQGAPDKATPAPPAPCPHPGRPGEDVFCPVCGEAL